MDNKKGFTFIEILVVLGIIGVLSGFGIAKYNSYMQQIKLKSEVKKLIDVFEFAKKKAVSSELIVTPNVTPPTYCTNFTGYRITLSQNNYLLMFGCDGTYEIIKTYTFPTNITVFIGTGNFDFLPLGNNTNFLINSIKLRNSQIDQINQQCIGISISPIGIVNIDETLVSC